MPAAVGAEQRLDARAHLLGRLVGERDREDFVRLGVAVADEVGDAAGDDARLAGPGAGEDQQRPVDVQDGLALFGVEGVEELHRARGWGLGARGIELELSIVALPDPEPRPRSGCLFDRDALGEIPRLIDVAAAADGDVVGEQLQRHDHDDRRQQLGRRRHLDDEVASRVEDRRRACRRRAWSAR